MIKPTFYNLPKEKKERLLNAAKKEFVSVSYNEASINKIIKDADISRGSFYTYFDDKSDLARCLLEEYFNTIGPPIECALKEGNGDIFLMFTKLFDVTLEYTELKNDMKLFHSLFRSMHSSPDFEGPMICDEKKKEAHQKHVMGMIDKEKLNVKNDDELKELLDLILIVTKQSIGKALSEVLPKDEARKKFLYKLDILKNGVLKHTTT